MSRRVQPDSDKGATGVPRWLLSSIKVLLLSLGGFFVAGQLGSYVGRSAALKHLKSENRVVTNRANKSIQRAPASSEHDTPSTPVQRSSATAPPPATPLRGAPLGFPNVTPWTSQQDGFGAMFSDEPVRREVRLQGTTCHAYQAQFSFGPEWSALTQITVVPIVDGINKSAEATFLAESHQTYLRAVGADMDSVQEQVDTYANGKPQLHYRASYEANGIGQVVSEGFWLFDTHRVLRVNVLYSQDLPTENKEALTYFPETFFLSDVASDEHTLGTEAPATTTEFVRLTLSNRVAVSLPTNWVALKDKEYVALETFVGGLLRPQGTARSPSTMRFAANHLDDERNVVAMFNFRCYPDMDVTQESIAEISVNEIDETFRELAEQQIKQIGRRILEWKGTKKCWLHGTLAVVPEYRRTGMRPGTSFCVRLIRVLDGASSFTVTVSYREDLEHELRPVCDQIINSIQP